MSTVRRLGNSWILWVATIVSGLASAMRSLQTSYKLTDLGTNRPKDNFSMAMGLNNQGWAGEHGWVP